MITIPGVNTSTPRGASDGYERTCQVCSTDEIRHEALAGASCTPSSPANGGVVGTGIACSAHGNILYFSGTTQIYSSTNPGATWNPTLSPFANWSGIVLSKMTP